MNHHKTAQGLASLGRNGDSMLVHMTPGEVAGLHKLAKAAGGSLTTNPHTGLTEAGFLSSMLPMIAGIGLDIASGGLATPLTMGLGAAAIGGADALATGSLKKGLIAGIGAYGGESLGQGLMAAGGVGAGAATAGPEMSASSVFGGPTADAASAAGPEMSASSVFGGPTADAASAAGSTASMTPPAVTPPAATPSMLSTAEKGLSSTGQGIKNLATAQPGAWSAFGQNVGIKGGLAAALPVAQSISAYQQEQNRNMPTATGSPAEYYNTTYDPKTQTYSPGKWSTAYAGPGYTPTAGSGQVPGSSNASGPLGSYGDPYNSIAPGSAAGGPIHGMAQGGIASLGHYSDGGRMLKGPGDGMSDDIPAVIHGDTPQPAALADSEFVIPADVVSHLGNGSSDAGAKVLYKMMDRVRKARTGTTKQGKQITPDKFMPT